MSTSTAAPKFMSRVFQVSVRVSRTPKLILMDLSILPKVFILHYFIKINK